MTLTLIIVLAVLLDHWFGEPRNSLHPLVAFGRWADYLERRLLDDRLSARRQRLAGLAALTCALLPCLMWLAFVPELSVLQAVLSAAVLYLCIAANSLQQHADAVRQALEDGNLAVARQRVGYIVSRETDNLDATEVCRAGIESVLENGADAIFAPLFWFVVFGPFGVLLHRLSNTLDAMWGYKNQRYQHFGWTAARLDDLLNWIPARLTAVSYAVLGKTSLALLAWSREASLLDSPNAGPVMTAGAGALDLQLGGPAIYHGQLKAKPWFGGEHTPTPTDINRACELVKRCLLLWIVVIAIGDSLA